VCFLPLIQRGNSGRPSAMPDYFDFYGTVPSDLYLVVKGPGVVFALVLYLGASEVAFSVWMPCNRELTLCQ